MAEQGEQGIDAPIIEKTIDRPPLESPVQKPGSGTQELLAVDDYKRSEFMKNLLKEARQSPPLDLLRGLTALTKEFLAKGFEPREKALSDWGEALLKEESFSPRIAGILANGLREMSGEQAATSGATESSVSSALAAPSSQETPSSE